MPLLIMLTRCWQTSRSEQSSVGGGAGVGGSRDAAGGAAAAESSSSASSSWPAGVSRVGFLTDIEGNIDYFRRVVERSRVLYFEPDSGALADLMRQAVHDSGPQGRGRALEKTAQARADMADMSPVRVAALMAARLRAAGQLRGWEF